MINAPNLPVAELAPIEDTIIEIETIPPVINNRPILARVATKEDIDDGPDAEMAIPVISTGISISNYGNHTDDFGAIVANNDNLDLTDTELPSITNNLNITKFINTRKRGLTCYTPILVIHLLYIFVNPIAIIFLLNMVYNLFTLMSCDINLIKTNISTNVATILLITLANILYLFNIDSLVYFFIKKEFHQYQFELYYMITLCLTSIIVIITYLYLTLILNKLRLLYNSFTPQQVNILSTLLK